MRHRVYGRKLGRNKNERTSLFRNLMRELFLHGTITTSKSKAAAIKGTIDKIITLAKNKNSQRFLKSFFADRLLQMRLIKEIAPKLTNRDSGYTSMIKVGVRDGDKTTLVRMSLIGLEELKPIEKVTKKVSRGKRVSQVSRVEKKPTPRGTRGTSKTRDISTKKAVSKKRITTKK